MTMTDYNKIPTENWPYYLYLEGMANELMHSIQQRRKEMKLELLDYVDVAIVESEVSKLTSAIHNCLQAIVDRCRIKIFSPNPLSEEGTRLWKGETIVDAFQRSFSYDLYIRKHHE
jgi:hypothetical protein